MDDCKKITATAKEPVVNVRDGARTANSTLKEISTKLKTVSVTPKDPLKCVRVDLKGLGEEYIPDPALFKYNEDKSEISDFLYKTFGRNFEEISSAIDALYANIGKGFVETNVTSDTISLLVNWVRNISDNSGYYSTGYAPDNYLEYQFKYIDILSVSLSKVLVEQGIAIDIASKLVAKVFSETSVASDVFAKTLQPAKIETAIASDVLTAVVDFNLTFQDWVYLTDDVLGNANVDDDQYMFMDKVILELMTYNDVLSSNLAKILAETAIGSDILAITSEKVLSESAIGSDSQVFTVGKGLVETGLFTDILSFNGAKVLAEAAIGADSLGITVGKVFLDSVAMTDEFGAIGWYGDSSIFTDVFSKSLSIVLDESDYFLSDYVQADYEAGALWLNDLTSFSFGKQQNEVAVASDVISYVMSFGRLFTETAIYSDTLSLSSSKVLSDSSILTDVFSKSLSIVLVDSSPISETVNKSVSISKTESAVMSEVRTANLQNYMVPLYVNAGYIGKNYSI